MNKKVRSEIVAAAQRMLAVQLGIDPKNAYCISFCLRGYRCVVVRDGRREWAVIVDRVSRTRGRQEWTVAI